jgi:hypothetical protein
VLLATFVLLAPAASAQTVPDAEAPPADSTRQGRLQQQRLEKKERLTPPEKGFLSKVAVRAQSFIERNQLVIDIPALDLYGVRPVLGGVQSGAGTTAGVRLPFFLENDNVESYVEALASLRSYYGVNGVLGYDPDGGWSMYGFGRYWHMPEEDFYGVGPEAEDLRSNYRLNEMIVGGQVGYEILPRVLVGGHVSYQVHRYGEGRDDQYITVEEATLDGEVPGLNVDVDYAVTGGFLEFDTRNIPYEIAYARRFAPTEDRLRGISLDATSGVYVAVEALPHFAAGKGDYDYTRFNVESQQYIPFRHGYQVLALREFVTLTYTPGENEIPFYEMETLGGSRTLRGFNSFRFRDRNAVLFNAEYRWNIFRPLDLALFVDAGHVFREVEDLALEADEFELSYGLGFRIKAQQRVIGRFDIAYSREGISTYLELGGIL